MGIPWGIIKYSKQNWLCFTFSALGQKLGSNSVIGIKALIFLIILSATPVDIFVDLKKNSKQFIF